MLWASGQVRLAGPGPETTTPDDPARALAESASATGRTSWHVRAVSPSGRGDRGLV